MNRLRALFARPPELAVRVGFNGVAQIAPIVVAVVITPLLLHRLGLDRYGIWSLALLILGTLTTLDGGVAASLTRFFAMYASRGEHAQSGRLLLGSLLFFFLFGIALTLMALPLAPSIVHLLDVPPGLEEEAVVVLRWLPPVVGLALMSDSTTALLQGNGQFRALAASMLASSALFVVAVIVLVQPGAQLDDLMLATALRYVILLIASLLFAAPRVSIGWPLLPSLATTRDLGRYASRMQVSAITGFVNSEMDALVIAAVLPIRYVGLYNIGLQAASAMRSLPLYAFAPIFTRVTTIFRREGREAAAAEFERLERRWLPAVLGYGVVAVTAVGFSVPVWLGDRYAVSGVMAAVLLSGYMVHVAFTGMRTCYVRAIGRPGLEARYSLVWTIGNSLITVPLGLLAGAVGVVAATAITGMIASTYFVVLCRRAEGLSSVVPSRRWWRRVAAATVITLVGELAILYTDLHGFFALALTGLPALVALIVFSDGLRQARGVKRPTTA